jgi:spermidine/putrescine transport system permease protein
VSAGAASVADGAAAVDTPPRRRRRRWRTYSLPIYVGLVIAYLLVPIAVMILYSFNGSNAHLPTVSFKLQGLTTEWYRTWNKVPGLTPAFFLSLRLAFATAITAAVLGTLLALALARHRFHGKAASEQILFLNIAAPEIVLGAALLGFFITLNLPKGFLTLFIAHVMFSIAYVVVTVRARLAGFDRSAEEAAQDLYATPWMTFWKVTLPLIFPAVLGGALLAFALSIDDFVTSNFVAGTTATFPLWVWGTVKVGIPPQVFVLGTLIFLAGVAVAVGIVVVGLRRERAARAVARVR